MKSLSILPFTVNEIDGQLSCKLLFTGQRTTDWQCSFAFADSVDGHRHAGATSDGRNHDRFLLRALRDRGCSRSECCDHRLRINRTGLAGHCELFHLFKRHL